MTYKLDCQLLHSSETISAQHVLSNGDRPLTGMEEVGDRKVIYRCARQKAYCPQKLFLLLSQTTIFSPLNSQLDRIKATRIGTMKSVWKRHEQHST